MLGKLVATGNKDADAYLRIARDIHVLDVAAADAAKLVDDGYPTFSTPWPPAETGYNPVGYRPAGEVAEAAPDVIGEAWKQAQRHYEAALAVDEKAARLADLHVGRLWDPSFTLDA